MLVVFFLNPLSVPPCPSICTTILQYMYQNLLDVLESPVCFIIPSLCHTPSVNKNPPDVPQCPPFATIVSMYTNLYHVSQSPNVPQSSICCTNPLYVQQSPLCTTNNPIYVQPSPIYNSPFFVQLSPSMYHNPLFVPELPL